MNDPIRQTKEEMSGGAKANAEIHDRTGLFIAVVALVVGVLGLGMGLAAFKVTDTAVDRATISENHWRNFEVQQKTDAELIARLTKRVEELEDARPK